MRPELPPVTNAHRRAAFAAMAWQGWSYEAAMANDTRRRVIEARAHQLRTQEWKRTATQTTVCVRRTDPSTGQWRTQRVPGSWSDEQTSF